MKNDKRGKRKGKKSFLQFQNDWNLDRVKKMTLEEYTGIKSEGERNDFTYILERKIPMGTHEHLRHRQEDRQR